MWLTAFGLKIVDDTKYFCASERARTTWFQLTAVFHALAGAGGTLSWAAQNEVLQRECGCFDADAERPGAGRDGRSDGDLDPSR